MPYIGNYIVSLNGSDARRKSEDNRFLNRVFTDNEQQLIRNSSNPDHILWSLWAAKESAYKAVRKKYGPVSSAPRCYETIPSSIEQESGKLISGIIETPTQKILFRQFSDIGFIHCICADSLAGLDSIRYGIQRLEIGKDQAGYPAYESMMARQAAIEAMASFFGLNPEELEIRSASDGKGSKWPMVYWKGNPLEADLSLSHDAPFVAYAFSAGDLQPAWVLR